MKYTFLCKVIRKLNDTEYEVTVNNQNIHELPDDSPTLRKVISPKLLPLNIIYVYDADFDPQAKTVTIINFGVLNLVESNEEPIIPSMTPAFSEKIKQAIQEANSYPIDLFKI